MSVFVIRTLTDHMCLMGVARGVPSCVLPWLAFNAAGLALQAALTLALAALCFGLMSGATPGLVCLAVGGAAVILQALFWRTVHLQYRVAKKEACLEDTIPQ